jgi:hypothetical protein
VTYEIRVFFEGVQKEVFSSTLKYAEQAELKLCPNLWPFWADISLVTYDEQNAEQAELKLCPNLWPFWADISLVTYDEQNAEQTKLKLCPNPS